MEARKKNQGWEVKLKNKIIFPQTFDTYIYGLSLASICCSFFFQALLLLRYSFLGYKWLRRRFYGGGAFSGAANGV